MTTKKHSREVNTSSISNAAKVKLLETILSSIPANIYWFGVDGEIVLGCNVYQALALKKQDTKELIGKSIYDFANKESAAEAVRNNLEVIKSGKAKVVRETLITKSGDKMVVLSHKVPLRDETSIVGVVGTSIIISEGGNSASSCIDDFFTSLIGPISEYTAIAEYIMAIKAYYESIIWQMPEHVYWTDKQGFLLGCNNKQAYDSGASSMEEVCGKNIYDFMSEEHALLHQRNNDLVLQTGEEQSFEETWKDPNGKEAVYISKKIPLRNKNKEILGILGISVDITERKQAEEELRIAKNRAELASEIKSQFIQNMEHDLRTPASGVYGVLNSIVGTIQDPDLKHRMQLVTNGSKRLLDFINDIIAFDKYASGQLPLVAHEFDLWDILNSIVEMELPRVNEKGIELKLDVAKDVPQHIISDKHRLFRIILNLVGNAVKFTKEGHVNISIGIEKQIDPRHCLLRIIVEDTGIGIPADKIHRIYERFERCVPSNKGLYPGAGLGLSITRQFIDELQGDVNVESKEGEGATFICIIPCKIPLADIQNYESIFNDMPTEAKSEKEKSYATVFTKGSETEAKSKEKVTLIEKTTNNKSTALLPKDTRILLVEDDEMAQLLANSTLKDILHVNYDLACTGKEALELWRKNKYEYILMDLGLPDTKGYQVAQQIRTTDKDTIIIALTAHNEDKYKQICKKAGMQGFLTKPLNPDQLLETLQDIQNSGEVKIAIEDIPFAEPEVVIDEKEIFDMKVCTQNATGSEAVAQVMIMVFIRQLPEYLAEFEGHYNRKDIESIGSLALKLKGASITIGAAKLTELAENLQHVTEFKKITMEDIEEPYKKVCAAIVETLRVVKKFNK